MEQSIPEPQPLELTATNLVNRYNNALTHQRRVWNLDYPTKWQTEESQAVLDGIAEETNTFITGQFPEAAAAHLSRYTNSVSDISERYKHNPAADPALIQAHIEELQGLCMSAGQEFSKQVSPTNPDALAPLASLWFSTRPLNQS